MLRVCCSWMKNNASKLWLLAVGVIVCAYFYHWENLPKRIPQNAEVITFQPTDDFDSTDIEATEVVDASPYARLEQEILRQNGLLPNVAEVPDMQQVVHTSKLMRLPKKIVYEEQLPHDVVPHAPVVKTVTPKQGQRVRIAIVIDDMGGSPKRTKEITALKAPLTASFLTFAPHLQQQVAQSKQAGHEIMIHVPMQPQSNIYVSEDVLKVDMSAAQIETGFAQMLQKFDEVKGINNHMGSRFTEHGDKLAPVMKLLAEKHLFFLDSKTTPKSAAEKVARQYKVPYLHRHVFLDNNNDFDYIMGQLAQTEKIARKNGYAIAIGHPKSQTSKALQVWLKTLDDKKIELVPLSALTAEPQP